MSAANASGSMDLIDFSPEVPSSQMWNPSFTLNGDDNDSVGLHKAVSRIPPLLSRCKSLDVLVDSDLSVSSVSTPPLPPKRRAGKDGSNLVERLRNVGIDVACDRPQTGTDETSDNFSDDITNTSNELRSVDSVDQSTAWTLKDKRRSAPPARTNTGIDLISKNLDEFELHFKKANRITICEDHFSLGRSASWGNSLEMDLSPSSQNVKDSVVPNSLTAADLNIFVGASSDSSVRPPRPPPPKEGYRFALPSSTEATNETKRPTELYFGDGMFDIVEEKNEEAVSFCKSVAEMRKNFKCSDPSNSGYITCPQQEFKDLLTLSESQIWPSTVYFEHLAAPKRILFDISRTVNENIAVALSKFEGSFYEVEVISNMYTLKVCGHAMYLTGNAPLINYVYVQDCLKCDKDLQFVILQEQHAAREFARSEEDDELESRGTYFKHFFEISTSTAISRHGLSILLEAYNSEVAKLLQDVTQPVAMRFVPERVIQSVKAVSHSLACVETKQIQEAVQLLLMLKPSHGIQLQRSRKKSHLDFNTFVNPKKFDRGRFNLALEKLTSGVFALVDLYCDAFDTDFTFHRHESKSHHGNEHVERISADVISDAFSVCLSSAHRIPVDWKLKYDYFELECGLYYGGKLLCPKVTSKSTKPVTGFFEHLRWDEVLLFASSVNTIPRETRLCLALYGTSTLRKSSSDQKPRNCLGWIGVNVYNFQGHLISGSHLFGLLKDVELNPPSTCATNYIQQSDSVVVKVDFDVYHTEVVFPEQFVPAFSLSAISYQEPTQSVISKLESAMNTTIPSDLPDRDRFLFWENRYYVCRIPQALPYFLASVSSWVGDTLLEVHELVSSWMPLPPTASIGILKADFPNGNVRTTAVRWLEAIQDDELCDILPQLVQALKYESYHDSALARFLIRHSLANPRVAHYLFWHLKYYSGDPQFCQRFQIVLGGLLSVCGIAFRDQVSRQDETMQFLSEAAAQVKASKESSRRIVLQNELNKVKAQMDSCIRLPTDPSLKVSELDVDECSYFSSFTVPLSLAFCNADSRGDLIKVMFKVGDDLRKDLVTLQLFRVMNRLWLKHGLELRMLTYQCLPTSLLMGMIELVPNASTMREIHVKHGVTGSLKDESIYLWLQLYNTAEATFTKAVDNFTRSCAAYCVATFVLGIGDRHNDNIMITQKGHLFHIDFSKFMGNAQKFGSIRRDRVPFVLTPDMAFVINRGEDASPNFQIFIELCCEAFLVLRRNANLLLNLLGLMVSSGIPYLSHENDLQYVRDALQLQLSDTKAMAYFTRLIESSLSSKSTQLNFLIHNMAHMKDIVQSGASHLLLLSFSNKIYSKESDGNIVSARVVDFQKRYTPEKHYIFVVNVLREGSMQSSFVCRRFEEFLELHNKLASIYSSTALPPFPNRVIVGRSQVKQVAMRRRLELDTYLAKIMEVPVISESELLYTFLHSFIRDEQDTARFCDILEIIEKGVPDCRVGGDIKLSFQYEDGTFHVLVMHLRNLIPRNVQGSVQPYVKCYLLPDQSKVTKRKTKIAHNSINPTFNEAFVYQFPMLLLQKKSMQVTVWDHDYLGKNDFLGGVNIYLSTSDLTLETKLWYKLKDIGMGE